MNKDYNMIFKIKRNVPNDFNFITPFLVIEQITFRIEFNENKFLIVPNIFRISHPAVSESYLLK